jgi:hypothetical protein
MIRYNVITLLKGRFLSNMCKRHKLLLKTLDNLERGLYTGSLDSYWCSETVGCLWKWRKITEQELHELCDRIIALH